MSAPRRLADVPLLAAVPDYAVAPVELRRAASVVPVPAGVDWTLVVALRRRASEEITRQTEAYAADRGTPMPDTDRRLLYLWLDAHVPFYGTYETEGLAAQRAGLAVSEPALQ